MTWEGDLQALERGIAVVSAEYDAFLYGSGARPPVGGRKNVERMMRALSLREADTAADRYRFSTLQGRWNALVERWERLQGEKEAGRRPGIYGHFQPAGAPETHRTPHPPNAAPPASVGGSGTEPGRDDPRRQLFEKYQAARERHGDASTGLDFAKFSDSLERESQKLREKFGGAEVEFDVAERDGRVKLVAKRKA